MRIRLHSPEDLTLSDLGAPGFHVETDEGAQAPYGALQLFAVSLGLCTASVLMGYGAQLKVPAEGLSVRLRWSVAEKPRRVEDLRMEIHWPALPESRLKAAERAAEHCTIHQTLLRPLRVSTTVTR
jgi:uncharacterized OsmC-like protein